MNHVGGWLYKCDDWEGQERAYLVKHTSGYDKFLRETDQRNLEERLQMGWSLVLQNHFAYYLQREKPYTPLRIDGSP